MLNTSRKASLFGARVQSDLSTSYAYSCGGQTTLSKQTEATMQVIDPAVDPAIETHVRAFLKSLNSCDRKPHGALAPSDARAVLTDLQKSESVEMAPAEVS